MLYARVYRLEGAQIAPRLLKPLFKFEIEYNGINNIAGHLRGYDRITDMTEHFLHFQYKHVLACFFMDDRERPQYDLYGVELVTYN